MTNPVIWHWREACEVLGLSPAAGPDITGVSIDTRTLRAGDLFVALRGDPGPRFHTSSRTDRDGHAFVGDAQARGAAGVLTHRATGTTLPELRVDDTLDGLWALGAAARRRVSGPVFAVTGSSGKTTVRSFLAAALGLPQVSGSLNNFWGVPLTLARIPRDASAAVLEIGTNHPGEIEPLSRLVNPTVALVLNVKPAHLEFFDSIAALRREKFSIFAGLARDGIAVLADDAPLNEVPGGARRLTFGRSDRADISLRAYRADTRLASYRVLGRDCDARIPGGGLHRALSLAAVLACLSAADLSIDTALDLPDEVVPTGRGTRIRVDAVQIIDDSYNANPASMAAALRGLAGEPARRTIAILGEMLELGADGEQFHRELAQDCQGISQIICVGAGMRALWDVLPGSQRLAIADHVDDLAVADLAAAFQPGDVVLVKGSNRVFWQHDFVARLHAALQQVSAGDERSA